MEAGRELDARIATEVMGMPVVGWGREIEGAVFLAMEKPDPLYLRKCVCEAIRDELGPALLASDERAFGHSSACLAAVPHYTTDIAADYRVHLKACTWIFSRRRRYFRALDEVIQSRLKLSDGTRAAWPEALMFYRVGDFSRAALIAQGVEMSRPLAPVEPGARAAREDRP